MNKEVKEKWVKALRSGEYKQGYSSLSDNNQYCCLGVLCELAAQEGICKTQSLNKKVYYDSHGGTLPPSVQEWAEINSSWPSVEVERMIKGLGHCNDILNYDFNRIADLIEEQL